MGEELMKKSQKNVFSIILFLALVFIITYTYIDNNRINTTYHLNLKDLKFFKFQICMENHLENYKNTLVKKSIALIMIL